MARRGVPFAVVVSAVLALSGRPVPAQTITDPEVAKGIRELDDGEFEAAILTLDAATRRLAGDPKATRDVAEAYLYLGVAYLGKGAETSAKAQFREALARAKDLKLSPEKFAPKVIEIFEKARDEVSAKPSASASPALAGAPKKKAGSSKGLLIGGAVVVAGGGVALAAGGGGASHTSATPTTTVPPANVIVRNGVLVGGTDTSLSYHQENDGPFPVGPWTMDLTWTDSSIQLDERACATTGSEGCHYSIVTGATSKRVEFTGSQVQYELAWYMTSADQYPGRQVTYTVTITHPAP